MKAISFNGAGGVEVIELIEVPRPHLRPFDLMVEVHAAGVNRADILQREGFYGTLPDFGDSTVPGLEMSGRVVELAESAAGFKIGDRVMAIVGGGAYSEFARVDSRMCMLIPKGLSYIEAAAIPEVFVTAHEALVHLGGAKTGDWALIHAAGGGVGSAAVHLANAMGVKVIFTVKGAERIERVMALGGLIGVDYSKEDFLEVVQAVTDGKGVDVVIDFIGGPYLERNVKSLREGGRLIQVGSLGGSQGTLPVDVVLHRYLRIIGTVMKSRPFEEKAAMTLRFREQWLKFFENGKLKAIVHQTFPYEQAADAHRAMEAAGNVGKIILTMK